MESPGTIHLLEYERPGSVVRAHSVRLLWINWLVLTPLWVLATVAASGIASFFWYLLIPPLAMASFVGVIAVLVVMARAMRTVRQARASIILATLEQIIRLNLPLGKMIEASARAERAPTRLRMERIAMAVTQGQTLGEALAAWVPEMSSGTIAEIALGERTGRTGDVLTALVRAERTEAGMEIKASQGVGGLYFWYPVGLSLFLFFLLIFVVPKFRDIFEDFQTPLPRPTAILVGLSEWLYDDWGWVFFVIPVAVLLMVVNADWWRSIFTPERRRFRPFASMVDAIKIRTPFLRTMVLSRGLAGVFGVLADQARNRQRLRIVEAAGIPANESVRRMVDRWGRTVESGIPLDEAARVAGLPPLVAGTVGPAMVAGRVAESLDFLARYYQQRYSRAWFFVRAAWVPVMVLLLGMFVLFMVMALMLPLATLIKSVQGGYA